MMTRYAIFLSVLIAAWAPAVGWAALIGDAAEPLAVKDWIKGQPVEIKPGTNIYVVEIWKTTGAASRAAITNLNRLQARFKSNGLIVVGVSDEPSETITNFMQHEGSNIEYKVAADEHRRTSMAYMEPAGQLGVPYAFVVGTNGLLLWHGHVLRGLEETLEQIIAGKFDLERGKQLEVADRQMEQYLALARRGDARTRAAGRALLMGRTNDVELLCDMAFEITTAPAVHRRDLALAQVALDQAAKLAPTNSSRIAIYRALVLFEGGKRDQGLMLATQALASAESPVEKNAVQSIMSTMEARQAAFNALSSGTNHLNGAKSPAPGQSGTVTNKSDTAQAKP